MKSYLKFLSRNKVYTFINIAGLAVSLMFVILIGDFAWRQFSIDSWHKNSDRIYIVGSQEEFFMWPQAAQEIKELCPEVEQTCRIFSQCGKIKHGEDVVKDKENGIIMMTDPTFFSFFDFQLIEGNPQTALDAPDKCVITESLAQKLFAGKNPIGEVLQLVGERNVRINVNGSADPYDSTLVYRITGIMEDLDRTVFPNETQVLVSIERYPQVMGYEMTAFSWAYGPTGTCKLLLKMKSERTEATRKLIQQCMEKTYPVWKRWKMGDVALIPLRDIMFSPQNEGYGLMKGDKQRLWIMLSAVLAILFFAVSNYINLTVANTGFRAKEMATRRLFGSTGVRISLKLITESTLMVFISFLIGLALAFSFEQDAASLFKGKIALARDMGFGSVSLCLASILIVGIVSGILPTWHLSRYQPIDIVKGSFRFRSKMVLSRVFIILQNVITVVMLTAALVIWLQLRHIMQAPMGFNTENLYLISFWKTNSQMLRDKLAQLPFVEKIGNYSGTTFSNYNNSMFTVNKDDKSIMVYEANLDSTAMKLYGLKVLRDFGETDNGYYLTEEGMRQLSLTDNDREIDSYRSLRGVIADFHKVNVLNDVIPCAIRLNNNIDSPNFLVKTNGSDQAMPTFKNILRELGCSEENLEFSAISLQEDIRKSLEDRENTLRIVSLFAIVAVVISVMGFVGMSLFFIRQRRNEIAVRKIMGSSSAEVLWLMLRTFCMPLLASFVIAIPLSYYVMDHWLEDFSYRITLSPWIFAVTCLFSLLTAILSVGFQIWRAARMNPAESIKTE